MSRIETSIEVPLCSYIIFYCSHIGPGGQTLRFAGRKTRTAVLCFTPERARWVANEQRHPWQKSRFEDGAYILEIPYSDDRELVLDILKHGPEVEVLLPKALRDKIAQLHEQAVRKDRTPGR